MTAYPPIQDDDPVAALARRLAVLDAITSALAEAISARAQKDRVDVIAMTAPGRSGLSPELVASFSADPGPSIHGLASDPQSAVIDWRFTTADARIKLKRLYPSL